MAYDNDDTMGDFANERGHKRRDNNGVVRQQLLKKL